MLAPVGGLAEAGDAFSRAIELARTARRAGDATWRTLFALASEGRAGLLYEQLRFAEAWHQGEADLAELGDANDLDAARVRLATSRARSGETNDAGPWVDDAQRVLTAARDIDDPGLELAAARELARARSEAGLGVPEDWIELGLLARQAGDAALEVSAITMQTAWAMASAPSSVPNILGPARELAQARGLVERLAWVEHAEAEAALGAGAWDLAISAGMRAIELGERHGYDRVTIRTWATVLPIASLRADRGVLDQAAAWFDSRAAGLPESPYGRMLLAGSLQWLAAAGVVEASLPPVELIRPAFGQWVANGSYEWLAATEAVIDAWFSAGQLEWLAEALDQAHGEAVIDEFRPAVLAFQLNALHLAGLDRSSGAPAEAAARARTVIDELRSIGLPFWVARGIRVLEGLGGESGAEVAERTAIEARLGIVQPTR